MSFRLICCMLTALVADTANAQRISCVHGCPEARVISKQGSDIQILPDPFVFDSQKTYRQPVVLITYSDTEFTMSDPVDYYNRLFNENGFNNGVGPGCVASAPLSMNIFTA